MGQNKRKKRQRNSSKKTSSESPEEKCSKVNMEEQNIGKSMNEIGTSADVIVTETDPNINNTIFGNSTTSDEKYGKLLEKMDKLFNEVTSIKATQIKIHENLVSINRRLNDIETDQEQLCQRVNATERKIESLDTLYGAKGNVPGF